MEVKDGLLTVYIRFGSSIKTHGMWTIRVQTGTPVGSQVQEIGSILSEDRKILSPEEYLVSVSSSVRRWVREPARALVGGGHNERWHELSSHDLRKSWATYHMVERETDVRIMMSIDGWSDYSTIEPSLG